MLFVNFLPRLLASLRHAQPLWLFEVASLLQFKSELSRCLRGLSARELVISLWFLFLTSFLLSLVFFPRLADVALSSKLSEEMKYEKESVVDLSKEPDFLQDFKAQGKWQVSTTIHHSSDFLSLTYSLD